MNIRRNSRGDSAGYSVVEMLVVVAIIGILSLVTIPAFMNFQRRNAVRSALRSFTSDLRSYRQHSITKNAYVRVQFRGDRDYLALVSTDLGENWNPLHLGTLGNEGETNVKTLPETIRISANTYNDSDDDDKLVDIDFRPNGTVGDFVGDTPSSGTITIRTDWEDILNTVVLDLSTTGQIKTTEKKS
jgi:prepilin-type N-terminal cleavage/methylation domain-containing protein